MAASTLAPTQQMAGRMAGTVNRPDLVAEAEQQATMLEYHETRRKLNQPFPRNSVTRASADRAEGRLGTILSPVRPLNSVRSLLYAR